MENNNKDEKGRWKKGNTIGNRWEKGQSGNPKGQQKKIIKQLEEQIGIEFHTELAKADYKQIIKWILERNDDELRKLASTESSAIVRLAVAVVKKAVKSGNMYVLVQLLDMQEDEIEDQIESSGLDLSALNTSELKQFMKLLDKVKQTEPKDQ